MGYTQGRRSTDTDAVLGELVVDDSGHVTVELQRMGPRCEIPNAGETRAQDLLDVARQPVLFVTGWE